MNLRGMNLRGMKLRDLLIGLVWLIGILGACSSTPLPPPFNPAGIPDTTCADACQHVDQDLQCQNGGACMDVCGHIENTDYRKCLLTTETCEEVDDCGLRVTLIPGTGPVLMCVTEDYLISE